MFYIALLLLASCKRELDLYVPDREPLLVVNADLDPDSFLFIGLSESMKITGDPNIPAVVNASVEVMNSDTQILEVLSHSGSGVYRSSWFRPETGRRYLLRLMREGREYWVDETMPDSLQSQLIDTGRVIFQGRPGFFQFRLSLKDPGMQNNYYGLRIRRFYERMDNGSPVLADEWMDVESMDFILSENPDTRFSRKQLLFKDVYFRGLRQEFRFGCSRLFDVAGEKTVKLELYVCTYSAAAYRYYVSVNEHLLYQNDPFSQPTELRGNVSNALGAAVGRFTRLYSIEF